MGECDNFSQGGAVRKKHFSPRFTFFRRAEHETWMLINPALGSMTDQAKCQDCKIMSPEHPGSLVVASLRRKRTRAVTLQVFQHIWGSVYLFCNIIIDKQSICRNK